MNSRNRALVVTTFLGHLIPQYDHCRSQIPRICIACIPPTDRTHFPRYRTEWEVQEKPLTYRTRIRASFLPTLSRGIFLISSHRAVTSRCQWDRRWLGRQPFPPRWRIILSRALIDTKQVGTLLRPIFPTFARRMIRFTHPHLITLGTSNFDQTLVSHLDYEKEYQSLRVQPYLPFDRERFDERHDA